ncbi:MAG: TIR domain-containing protein [Verrucomicrobiales bacterium]|nr:TIR domain-containing protein [Verrucomicrobiales bacterium]
MENSAPLHDPGLYDLFVSYSTKDNVPPPGESIGWVYAFIHRLRELAPPFTDAQLHTTGDSDLFPDWDTFYAPDEIQPGHLWETRLRTAVAQSRVLIACLSPNYWQSKWCRIEWETYLENESARGLANQVGGITPIYFVTAPGVRSADIVAAAPDWASDLLESRQVRLLELTEHGDDLGRQLAALRDDPAMAERVGRIAQRVAQQISHARRAERIVMGNIALGTETFVGRETELADLEKKLFGTGALSVITALHGIGGQGKTALALRYGQNLRTRYSGGCWQAGAEGARELIPLVASLRDALELPPIATEDDTDTALRVLQDLYRRAHDPDFDRAPGDPAAALLLLDNVEHADLLGRHQREHLYRAMREATGDPGFGWLHLLATTRLESHELASLDPAQIVAVDALSAEKALELWRRISGPLSDSELEAAREIIRLLERHTLSVEVAVRHIRRTLGETAVTYLARLRHALSAAPDRLARLLGGQQAGQGGDLPSYAHPLAATLGFTFTHLAEEDPAAAAVLHFAAHFPAEAVPLPWLRILAGQAHPALLDDPEAVPGLPDAWDRVLLRLGESLALLTPADAAQPEIGRLHRLAAACLRFHAQEEGGDAPRLAAVEQFIEFRCTLAEHNPQGGLLAWERTVLLADLPLRMGQKNCSAEMAQNGLLLGQILASYADLATARRLTEQAHGVLTRLAASDPANAAWQRDLSVSLEKLGDLAVAQGDGASAARRFSESLAIRERLAASDPANAAWQRDLAVSLNKLGDLAVAQGDLTGAARYFAQDLAIAERLAASDPANAAWQRDLYVSLIKLGDLAVAQGDGAGAARRFTESLAIAERLAASDPANDGWQRDLSVSLDRLGDLAVAQGDGAGAARRFTESLAIRERLAASDPANAAWQRDLSVSLNKLGELAVAQGDGAGAAQRFTESHAIFERIAAIDPANAAWQRDLSVSLNKLGDLAVAQGDGAGAAKYFAKDLAIAERLAASDPANAEWQRDLAVSHFKLYSVAQENGDDAAAVAALRACFAVLEGMKQRGMHLDPPMAQLHEQLAGMFAGGDEE